MKKAVMDQEILAILVKKLIRLNRNSIWEEALERYGLIGEEADNPGKI